MLTGHVTPEREAVVPVEVLGADGQVAELEATLDTGYNGYLTLPPAVVAELELPFAGTAKATLGDGQEVALDLFLAKLAWEEGHRNVLVLEAEGGVLLGMAALSGSRVILEVVDDGRVMIEPM